MADLKEFAEQLVNLTVKEVSELAIGDKVIVASKAFNPVIKKI